MDELFDDFQWHSSVGLDELPTEKDFVAKLANTPLNMQMFIAGGDKCLIHKSTKALWMKSEDGESLIPVFGSDVLTKEEVEQK